MNIPVEIVAALLALVFGGIISLQVWLVRRVFTLEARLMLLIAVLEEHFGFRLPTGNTNHIHLSRKKI
jgi:hypothetical protein